MAEAMAAPSAVIFDLGGVVLNSPFSAIADYETRNGIESNTINKVIGAAGEEGAFARAERGEISVHEFAEPFAHDCKLVGAPPLDGSALMSLILESCTPRPLMLEALGILRDSEIKTAALTNNFRSQAGDDRFTSALVDLQPLFDVIVQSAEEGVRKPDPRIYSLACTRLGVAPHECVFLDDIGRNLKPAQAMGMRTIRVGLADSTGGAAVRQLSAMLGGQVGQRLQSCLRRARL